MTDEEMIDGEHEDDVEIRNVMRAERETQEKEIKEMACKMCGVGMCDFRGKPAEGCNCEVDNARRLYDAGYRKIAAGAASRDAEIKELKHRIGLLNKMVGALVDTVEQAKQEGCKELYMFLKHYRRIIPCPDEDDGYACNRVRAKLKELGLEG